MGVTGRGVGTWETDRVRQERSTLGVQDLVAQLESRSANHLENDQVGEKIKMV
jgi:hypothetical protein